MTMNLKLVTFDIDLTQFLVNAETTVEAIEKAHEANRLIGGIDGYDMEGIRYQDYTVEDVDWDLLREILARKDCLGDVGDKGVAVCYAD